MIEGYKIESKSKLFFEIMWVISRFCFHYIALIGGYSAIIPNIKDAYTFGNILFSLGFGYIFFEFIWKLTHLKVRLVPKNISKVVGDKV